MKALVTYYTDTGNTEKLARAIYEAIHLEKEIKPVADVQSSDGYDIIFCGFPVQAQSVPRRPRISSGGFLRARRSPSSRPTVPSAAARCPDRLSSTPSASLRRPPFWDTSAAGVRSGRTSSMP